MEVMEIVGNMSVGMPDLREANVKYDYPEGLDLRPGSELSKKIITEINIRSEASRSLMSPRYKSWNDVDKVLTAYVNPEAVLQHDRAPRSRAVPVSIPVSYAIREILLTYLIGTFLSDKIFRYEGFDSKDTPGAYLMEQVIAKHCIRFKVGLQLHTMFSDALTYGFGLVTPVWERLYGYKRIQKTMGGFEFLGQMFPSMNYTEREYGVRFEGNKLESLDPYKVFLDPYTPVQNIQDSEFVGWLSEDNYNNLLVREKAGDEGLFNVKYIKLVNQRSKFGQAARSRRALPVSDKTGGIQQNQFHSFGRPTDVLYMYINLIPEEWKLGKGDSPERWIFGVANDAVVIKANVVELDHDTLPIISCAPEYDGYGTCPLSKLEIIQGMHEQINWLYTSHTANVKKAVNDRFVVDPALVNMEDLVHPLPGGYIRLRKRLWGKGITDAIQQLKVQDVTQGHIADSMNVFEMLQKISGVGDVLFGAVRGGGERRSATEYRETKIGALSRLEKTAMIASLQSMVDISFMFASHTQQFMEEDTFVKIAGDLAASISKDFVSGEKVKVRPADLLVDYDLVFHDGSMPGGEYLEAWVQMFQMISSNPVLAQKFDMPRIFLHVAKLMGAKTADEFVLNTNQQQPQVLPDEEVLREAEKGNVAPIEEVENAYNA